MSFQMTASMIRLNVILFCFLPFYFLDRRKLFHPIYDLQIYSEQS